MTRTKSTHLTLIPSDDDVPTPDPRLVALLRDAVGDVPYNVVDWGAMQQLVVSEAAELLSQRQRRPWFTSVARWSRVAIPCGVAAGIAAAALVAVAPLPERDAGTVIDEAGVAGLLSPATLLAAITPADRVGGNAGIAESLQTDALLSRIVP